MAFLNGRFAIFFASLLALIISPAYAFDVSASTNNIGITSCTEGKVFVHASNPESKDGVLSFTASYGELNGYFESPSQTLPAGADRGTYIHISASQCTKGTQDVIVYAQLCIEGTCTVEQETIRVTVTPCSDCSGTFHIISTPIQTYIPAQPRTSDGTVPLASGIYFSTQYDPSYYELEIYGPEEINLRQRDLATVELSLLNRGAAATFDLRLIGEKGYLQARLSDDYVSLARGEQRTITLEAQPSTVTGQYCVGVQASRGSGIVVQEKFVCFNIYDSLGAIVKLPSSISTTRCDASYFVATVENTGTALDTYHFKAGPYAYLDKDLLTLAPEESGQVTVNIDAYALSLGRNEIAFEAEGESFDQITGLPSRGSGTISVFVNDCPRLPPAEKPPQEPIVKTSQEKNGTLAQITVEVKNDGDAVLQQVTATIIGLPQGWTVMQKDAGSVDIPAKSSRNVTLFIQPSTQDEANGTLVIKSGDTPIYSSKVKINGATGEAGFIGFFTAALSNNLLFISILILGALVIAVMAARRKQQGEGQKNRLEKIKQSITEY